MSEGTIRTRIVTEYRTPEESLRLTEDVFALDVAIQLLKTVDHYNVQEDPDKDTLWMLIQKLKECQRYARRKLAKEFLVPQKKIQRR